MRTLKHIAIAGNIGAGKTTLTEMLAKHYNWDVQYEDTTTNPYLADAKMVLQSTDLFLE